MKAMDFQEILVFFFFIAGLFLIIEEEGLTAKKSIF